jgi:hypothetical protein
MFSQVYSENAIATGWSETKFVHQKFEKLLVQARAELNDAKRRECTWKCSKLSTIIVV